MKMQFSKKVCLYAMTIVALTIAGNFVLSWFDKNLLSDVAIAVIGTFGGFVCGGYFALSGARDWSTNKHAERNKIKYPDGVSSEPE